MKRVVIIIAAVVAVAALGVGVTVGSTSGSTASAPRAVSAPAQDSQTRDQRACEEAAKQLRAKHPDAYIGGCNHGASTVPTP